MLLAMLCALLRAEGTWEHCRYGRIHLLKSLRDGRTDAECYVTEKADGANLCLITDGDEMVMASRNELLAPKAKFYNSWPSRKWLKKIALNAHGQVRERIHDVHLVYMYGELIGNTYKERRASRNGKYALQPVYTQYCHQAINGRVFYSPNTEYYGIEIRYTRQGQEEVQSMDYDVVIKILQDIKGEGIEHYIAPVIKFHGTHERALEYIEWAAENEEEKRTLIPDFVLLSEKQARERPEASGRRPIRLEENEAEGVVIRAAKMGDEERCETLKFFWKPDTKDDEDDGSRASNPPKKRAVALDAEGNPLAKRVSLDKMLNLYMNMEQVCSILTHVGGVEDLAAEGKKHEFFNGLLRSTVAELPGVPKDKKFGDIIVGLGEEYRLKKTFVHVAKCVTDAFFKHRKIPNEEHIDMNELEEDVRRDLDKLEEDVRLALESEHGGVSGRSA